MPRVQVQWVRTHAGSAWRMFSDTWKRWSRDRAWQLAASVAFYTVLSLSPMLVIAVAIAGAFFGTEAATGEIVRQAEGFVGRDGAVMLSEVVERARKPGHGIIATIIGTLTLIFGALGVFVSLQDSLNLIWNVKPKESKRWWLVLLKDRLLSLAMVAVIGFLLLVSLAVNAALAALGAYFGHLLPRAAEYGLIQGLNFIVSFAVTTFLFAAIFKILPDVELRWRDVGIGAALTALLFSVGRFAIGLYLGKSSVGSVYGAAGSLVVLLVWVYYSAQIVFFGAELTRVYTERRRGAVPASAHAQKGGAANAKWKDGGGVGTAAREPPPAPAAGGVAVAEPEPGPAPA